MIRTRMIAALVAAALPAALAAGQSRGKPDPAEWTPAGAVAFIGVSDSEAFWASLKKTTAYEILSSDPGAQKLKRLYPLADVLHRFKERLARTLDVPPAQLKSPFGGPIAVFAALPPGARPDDLAVVAVAGVGDAAVMKQYHETAVRKLREIAGNHESVSAGENSIDVFTGKAGAEEDEEAEEEDEPDTGPTPFGGTDELMRQFFDELINKLFSSKALPPRLGLCLARERLIVAAAGPNSAPQDLIREVLKRDSRSGSLAESDDYKALQRHLKPLGEVRWLVNLPRILEIAQAEPDADPDLSATFRMLGFDGLRSAVGHARFGEAAFDSKYELLFLLSGERSGLVKLLSMDNRDITPPATVSSNASVYASVNVRVAAVIDEVLRMMAQRDAAAAEEARASMDEMEIQPGQKVSLRKDFFDHLREPLIFTMEFAQPLGADSLRMLLSLGHANREAIGRFFGMVPGVTPRDVRGHQVFEMPGNPFTMGVAAAATGNRLVLGNTSAVEAATDAAASEPLSADRSFRAAAQHVPREAWGTIFVNERKMMDAMVGLLEKKDELLGGPPTSFSRMILYGIATSLKDATPGDLKELAKNSAPSILTLSTTSEGVHVTAVKLRPEKD